ncbi:DUF2905 domain-containing protein [Membranihabitans maritimus]|uniref:DUF2905 domain-containing protein n=1 Tax=Membranihabitans maritimus TaxID=2904244 RepID=UPI001F3D7954|nr:DUF2905 domain-containing protein [Membranihabitans maritimus]
MNHRSAGIGIVIAGVLIIAVGALIYFTGFRWISWFGNLPGDIRIENENSRFYFPIVSMILVSIILSVVMKVLNKIL